MAADAKYPCKGCAERHATCHCSCDRYKAAKAAVEEMRMEAAGKAGKEREIDAFKTEAIHRVKKRMRNHWNGRGRKWLN